MTFCTSIIHCVSYFYPQSSEQSKLGWSKISSHCITMESNHITRPQSIRLFKLTLLKQIIHNDFNKHTESSRSNRKFKERRIPWMSVNIPVLYNGFWILKYFAFHKKFCGIWKPSENKRNTWCPKGAVKKIEHYPENRRLEILGHPPAWQWVTKEKRDQKDFTYCIDLTYGPSSWWMQWEHTGWWDYCTKKSYPCFIIHIINLSKTQRLCFSCYSTM